jgi:hypothetical protein
MGQGVELLISFNFDDVHLAEAVYASLFVLEPDRQFVLSPTSYGAVLFEENIAAGVYEADAFALLVGPKGLSSWQEVELGVALERNRQDPDFSVVGVLAGNSSVPSNLVTAGLKWINLPVVTDRTMLRNLLREFQKTSVTIAPKVAR